MLRGVKQIRLMPARVIELYGKKYIFVYMKHFHLPVIALVAMVVASCSTTKYVSKS